MRHLKSKLAASSILLRWQRNCRQDAVAYDIIRGAKAHENAAVDASLTKLRKLESSTTYPLLLALLQKVDDGEMGYAQLVKAIDLIDGFILRRYATNLSSRTYGRWFVAGL